MAKQLDSSNLGYLIGKIKAAFWRKSETSQISIDSTPTSGSNNLVTSGGVHSAVDAKYTKPSGGIPASDLASGVLPSYTTEEWTIYYSDSTSAVKKIMISNS